MKSITDATIVAIMRFEKENIFWLAYVEPETGAVLRRQDSKKMAGKRTLYTYIGFGYRSHRQKQETGPDIRAKGTAQIHEPEKEAVDEIRRLGTISGD